jgi:hypothetical protein
MLLVGVVAGAVVVGAGALGLRHALRFAPDTTPEGAYERIAFALARGLPRDVFAYLEDAAQHACFTIRDYRSKSLALAEKSYPEAERLKLVASYRQFAAAPDGADVWVLLAEERGFTRRLRRDLSGIARVEIDGERASIETARGTRYPFRRREVGIWGLALFTAELVAEAERAARDHELVEIAARDYERASER